jgi:hypothetical protein
MIRGEPIVRKEIYTNQVRILAVAMPSLSPMAVQTPKSCHSMKCLKLFMVQKYKI